MRVHSVRCLWFAGVQVALLGIGEDVAVAGDEGEAVLAGGGYEQAVGWVAVNGAGQAGGFDENAR